MKYNTYWKKQPVREIESKSYGKYIVYGFLLGIAAFGMWKLATHDYCPAYYGVKCLPPTNWKTTIKTDKHFSPQTGTGAIVQSANGFTQ